MAADVGWHRSGPERLPFPSDILKASLITYLARADSSTMEPSDGSKTRLPIFWYWQLQTLGKKFIPDDKVGELIISYEAWMQDLSLGKRAEHGLLCEDSFALLGQ